MTNEERRQVCTSFLRLALLCGVTEDLPCVAKLQAHRDTDYLTDKLAREEATFLGDVVDADDFEVVRVVAKGPSGAVSLVRN